MLGVGVRPISRLALAPEEAATVRALAADVADRLSGPLESHLTHISVRCHELPLSVREALVDLRLAETRAGGLVVSGLTVIDADLGPTPSVVARDPRRELRIADATLLLFTSLMGDLISHAGIENGRMIRDVCPIRGNETTQLGSSSLGELAWHVEDAFHDFRADWVALLCLRNPSQAATSFARFQDVDLDGRTSAVLFQKRFPILPDSSHLGGPDSPAQRPIAVLSGDPKAPFVRLDPAFMPAPEDDDEASEALAAAIDGVNRALQDVVLQPGELFIIDNMRSVHGRRQFEARFDGRDRWLRAAHAATDLTKSAGRRSGSHGRAIAEQP
jgi:Fe(II)/alpha-ketoglutarate-dependent arginine beta-hydroxylase